MKGGREEGLGPGHGGLLKTPLPPPLSHSTSPFHHLLHQESQNYLETHENSRKYIYSIVSVASGPSEAELGRCGTEQQRPWWKAVIGEEEAGRSRSCIGVSARAGAGVSPGLQVQEQDGKGSDAKDTRCSGLTWCCVVYYGVLW
ncbi:hypothetical protein E2C01_007686 [Portunus trituberculatus]|uniref:Uncharacterized protein n=1 Tax=Portunus trituberculatus TaxID=210409 RepID=A0A5B7D0C2_PORTR|nr:hypothetical protein [Portunus trituberculatus]